jgi:hypothetical protein
MKPQRPILLSTLTLAAALGLGACYTTPASHWDAEHAAESASYHFLGANGQTDETILQTTKQGSREITLTMRRHFFNDNPHNPLQEHRYEPYDRYIPIWHMPAYAVLDTAEIATDGLVHTGEGSFGAILMPWQLLAGTSAKTSYKQPPPPSEFEIKND